MTEVLLSRNKTNASHAMIRSERVTRTDCKGAQEYAFKSSASVTIRDRGDEARPEIMAEL